jgi:oxidoreductase
MLQGLTQDGWAGLFPNALPDYQACNPQPDFARLLQAVKTLWTNAQPGNYPGEAVRTITAPTLLIRGDADELCSLQELAALQQRIAGSALLNAPFAGHDAQRDAPALLAPALAAFFG